MKKAIFGKKYSSTASDLLDQLSSYWKFDGDANDSMGIANGEDIDVNYGIGKINECANFIGSWNSHVIIPYSSGFDFVSNGDDTAFTISFWVKRNDFLESAIAWRASNSVFSWNLRTEPNGIGMRLFSQGGSGSLMFCGAIVNDNLGEWNHVVFTYDGSKIQSGIKAYVNGMESYAASIQNEYLGMGAANIGFSFGRRLEQAFGYFNGSLDEFAIWKGRVLNPIEIFQVFNSGIE